MKSNKGFTLIELLAVIVILAIIALIATPMVLNTIDDARKGAAQSSALAYVKQVELQITTEKMDDPNYNPGSVTDVDFAEVKGDKPSSINLTVSNGIVTGGTLVINGYTISYEDGKATAK